MVAWFVYLILISCYSHCSNIGYIMIHVLMLKTCVDYLLYDKELI